MKWRLAQIVVVSLLGAWTWQPAAAQTARITGVSTVQYVQLRPLVIDSVPVEETTGDGLIRRALDGLLVRCVTGDAQCRGTRSGSTTAVVPMIHDISVNAWGIGRGIRVQAQLRARTAVGGHDELWPRADDRFDALSLFIELDRDRYRIRAGRQWLVSGLGYYNFDGGDIRFRLLPGVDLEAFGGWSLARGLNEPRTSESLAAIEPFAPDKRALLFGAKIAYRPAPRFAASILYQREIRDDRLGLYAERAAVDAVFRWSRATIDASLEADVASHDINDARLTARVPVSDRISGRTEVRSYSPFFELWTIWGAFEPVGFVEASIGASVRPASRFAFDIGLARRNYAETDASRVFGDYRSSGWTVAANADWNNGEPWSVSGDYRVDFGFGAARSGFDVRAQRDLGDVGAIGFAVLAFQRQFEFRVTEGTVYGLAADGQVRVGARTRLDGSLSAYRHNGLSSEPGIDWSQLRGQVRLSWTLGPEPGVTIPVGAAR